MVQQMTTGCSAKYQGCLNACHALLTLASPPPLADQSLRLSVHFRRSPGVNRPPRV